MPQLHLFSFLCSLDRQTDRQIDKPDLKKKQPTYPQTTFLSLSLSTLSFVSFTLCLSRSTSILHFSSPLLLSTVCFSCFSLLPLSPFYGPFLVDLFHLGSCWNWFPSFISTPLQSLFPPRQAVPQPACIRLPTGLYSFLYICVPSLGSLIQFIPIICQPDQCNEPTSDEEKITLRSGAHSPPAIAGFANGHDNISNFFVSR